jgi:hypothetical protein
MSRFAAAVVMLVVLLVVPRSTVLSAQFLPVLRVRALDAWANESLERGQQGAAVVRELMCALAESDLIVHVETSTTLPPAFRGLTRLVSDTGEHRYVRITLDRDLAADDRAATLAHELQHAIELAHSDARSASAVHRLYERIGYRLHTMRPYYDTVAAQQAGARAWTELRGAKRLTVGPRE